MIEIACACGKKLNAPDALAGKKARCPVCKNVHVIPSPAPSGPDELVLLSDDGFVEEGNADLLLPPPSPAAKRTPAARLAASRPAVAPLRGAAATRKAAPIPSGDEAPAPEERETPERSRPGLKSWLGAAGALAVGACFVAAGWWMRDSMAAMAKWPAVEGRIESSGIKEKKNDEGKAMYAPEVEYTYTVNDRTYTGDRIQFTESSSNMRSFAEGIASKYTPGAKVSVHYDPQAPGSSILDPKGGGWFPWVFILLGLLAVAGSLSWIWKVFRSA